MSDIIFLQGFDASAKPTLNGKSMTEVPTSFQGDWVTAINGEVYNAQALNNLLKHYDLGRSDFDNNSMKDCITQVVLSLFIGFRELLLSLLDGCYSALFFNYRTHDLYLLRDYIGTKPLFFGCSDSDFFVSSELKNIHGCIHWFKQVPKGLSRIDLVSGQILEVTEHLPQDPKNNLVKNLTDAVKKRLPADSQPVGIFLSGGLDSSIIAAIASNFRPDLVCFVLGSPDYPDHNMGIKVAKSLGFEDIRLIGLPSANDLEELIDSVVYHTESFNPSIVSNGLSTYLLGHAARSAGITTILTGEGSDELFGGYYSDLKPDELQKKRLQLIRDLHYTELRRLYLCSMAHGIDAKTPFLDQAVFALSEQLSFTDIYRDNLNKVILRDSFRNRLPAEIINRPKTSFDVGSGVRELVVDYLHRNGRSEREELRTIWLKHFEFKYSKSESIDAYFYSYPAFDSAIDRRKATHQ